MPTAKTRTRHWHWASNSRVNYTRATGWRKYASACHDQVGERWKASHDQSDAGLERSCVAPPGAQVNAASLPRGNCAQDLHRVLPSQAFVVPLMCACSDHAFIVFQGCHQRVLINISKKRSHHASTHAGIALMIGHLREHGHHAAAYIVSYHEQA